MLRNLFNQIKETFAFERNVAILSITSAIGTFGNSLWIFFLPLYFRDIGAQILHIGFLYTLSNIIGILVKTPAGYLSDKYGRKVVIVTSSLTLSFSVCIFTISENIIIASVAYILFSIGSSLLSPALMSMLTESVHKRQRGTAVGAFYSIAPSLASIGPIIGGILSEKYCFKLLFSVGFILLLATAIVRAKFLRETLQLTSSNTKKTMQFSSIIHLFTKDKRLMALLIAYSIYGFAAELTWFLVPLFSRSILRLGMQEIGFLYSLLSAVNLSVGIPFGKLADKIGRRKTIIISWTGENLFMLAFVFSSNFYLAALAFGLWIAFGQMDTPARTAWISDLTEDKYRATVMGIYSTLGSIISLPSPSLGGVFYSISPYLPFYADGILSLVALMVLLLISGED